MTVREILNRIGHGVGGSALTLSFVRRSIPAEYLDAELSLRVREDGDALAVFLGDSRVVEAELKDLQTYETPDA